MSEEDEDMETDAVLTSDSDEGVVLASDDGEDDEMVFVGG